MVNRKAAPPPGRGSTHIRPPCAVMIPREIVSPSPATPGWGGAGTHDFTRDHHGARRANVGGAPARRRRRLPVHHPAVGASDSRPAGRAGSGGVEWLTPVLWSSW